MSDHFITNITGVPTTGQYGPDGKPLNVNNDGGIEVTPQNAGNVPSASTESREGIGNDKSIAGNAYNQSASSTDAQAIGPAPAKDQTHYAYTQAHSLYKQASIGGDPDDWNLYTQDPVDVRSGYHSTYDGYYSILNEMDLEEGQPTVVNTPLSPASPQEHFTFSLGANAATFVLAPNNRPGAVQVSVGGRPKEPQACLDGTVDIPCEVDKICQGKKVRIFQTIGSSCDGMNGYWMQVTNPVNIGKPTGGVNSPIGGGRAGKEPQYNEDYWKPIADLSPWPNLEANSLVDCNNYKFNPARRWRINTRPADWNFYCYVAYTNETQNNPYHNNGKRVWAHMLTYIGTELDLAKIGDKKWCEYCDQYNPESKHSPARKPCDEVVGWRKMFVEGPSCNKEDQPDDTYAGKLYGCCCKHKPGTPANTPRHYCSPCYGPVDGNTPDCQHLVTLQEVGGWTVTMGSKDDPCDCMYREHYGPMYWDETKSIDKNLAAVTGNGNQRAFVTGCLESEATSRANFEGGNVWIMSTGSGAAPYFNSGECAWMYSLRSGVKCTGLDALGDPFNQDYNEAYGYCPTGDDVLISDRDLHYAKNQFTSYTGCVGAICNPQTICENSKFEVGDRVMITPDNAYRVGLLDVRYQNPAGSWSGTEVLDLFPPGDGTYSGTSPYPQPFSSGCSSSEYLASVCAWTFSETGAEGPQYPGSGYWQLSSSGTCCDCDATQPTLGLQGDGTYIWNDNEVTSADCNTATSGCDVLTQPWLVISKASGIGLCSWGYQVSFTGSPATGECAVTGYAPYYPHSAFSAYIPESNFSSGTY